jgi:hypothetical protein|tara:strand:- start:8976 stop:9386 length:411 start_codon:yes stop_codon:yes gene_type:complete
MEKRDKMKASLEKNLPTVQNDRPIELDKDVKDDYEFSRDTYRDLINTGVRSLDVLAELARESEHPRAFEVLSKSIKDIGDTTEKLMALQKTKKDLKKEADESKRITNNNVFVGSTTELQRLLLDDGEKDNVIDVDT